MAKHDYQKGVKLAIGIFLIIVVVAAVIPDTFNIWFDAPYYEDGDGNTVTDWPSTIVAIWDLIPLFATLGFALIMYRKVEKE